MRVIYYTAGLTGSGHIVKGISIYNAFKRKGKSFDYLILNNMPSFASLADHFAIPHREIPVENEVDLSAQNYQTSILYRTLVELNPDVLLVDLFWFTLHHFLPDLPCKKVFLCRQIDDKAFRIPLDSGAIQFRPEDYDLVLAVEPFKTGIPMEHINPIIIRNRNEIMGRDQALESLGLQGTRKNCLFALNGRKGEFEYYRKTYSYLEDVGYTMVYSSNYRDGLFPVVDFFNAFDLIISAAGYNAFWEAIYFKKESIFLPQQRRFEDQRRRVEECQEYSFDSNGADELVKLIAAL